MREKIHEELNTITYLVDKLYQNKLNDVLESLNQHFKLICDIMIHFLQDCDQYKAIGIDVPKEILLSQIKNLMDAYEKMDPLMLADVLKYEISEALRTYEQILVEMGSANEE